MTINCVTRTPEGKYFVTFLKRNIEKCIETHNVLAARVELLQVSGVAVESKRCCGFKITRLLVTTLPLLLKHCVSIHD